jgi:hypothetical protein
MKRLILAACIAATATAANAGNYPPVPYVTAPIEAGTAPFNNLVSSINANSEGLLHAATFTPTTAVTAGVQALDSYTLPAAYLATLGQSIRVKAWFNAVSNVNNKTPIINFGTVTYAGPAVTTAGVPMMLECIVTKTGASTQNVVCDGTTLITPIAAVYTAATQADTAAIAVGAGCTAPTTAGDCTLVSFTVETVR